MKKVIVICLFFIISLFLAYEFNFRFLDFAELSQLDQFLSLFFLTCPLTYILYSIWSHRSEFTKKRKVEFTFPTIEIRENLIGIGLAIVFFLTYLYFGLQINIFGAKQVDNLFDADTGSWIRRIASDDVRDFEMRGPHPFTYFLFRPFGFLFNLFTDDPIVSATLFNSLIGGLCVLLAWLFIKRQFENKTYAFLIASLLGLSSPHMFFGSVVDTYISSAFSLILFFFLLQKNEKVSYPAIFVSILTFGITLTNFTQNLLGFIVARPRLKDIFNFVVWVCSVSLLLTFLHAAIYPESKMFFITADAKKERKFFALYNNQPDWRSEGRNLYLTRTLLLYPIVAPQIFILTDEVGSTIPELRFYKISIKTFHQAQYEGLGQGLVIGWGLMLVTATGVFLWNLIRTRKVDMAFSFLLCLAFNLGLHYLYGQELFLYTADWTYALIFFVGFGLAPFSKNRFFQAGMFVYLILLAYHQWKFMDTILQTLLPFIQT